MKVLSLFDGISTCRVALEKLGINVEKYYASEIDKNAIAISKYNFSDIEHIGDITKIDFEKYKDVDLISSGSPCQNLSICNRNRQGITGSNSNLFFYFIKALEIIKPKYFIQENVFSMKNEDKEIITESLKNIYPDTQMYVFDSALVSAQKRKRIYWTNIPNIGELEDKHIYLKDILEHDTGTFQLLTDRYGLKGFKKISDKANCLTATLFKGYGNDGITLIAEPVVKLDKNNEILTALNNKRIELKESDKPYSFKEVRTEEGKKARHQARLDGLGDTTPRTPSHKMFIPKDDNKANCLTTTANFERVVCIPITSELYNKIYTVKDGMIDNKFKIDIEDGDYIIRKLTPLECDRLQTMPDDYTKYGINEKNEKVEMSKSARYKALGNAWTADVIAHIFKGLK